MRALATNECQGTCSWGRAQTDDQPAELEGQPLFECSSCRSEWVPTEGWTPRNADGTVAPEIEVAKAAATVVEQQPTEGTTGSW